MKFLACIKQVPDVAAPVTIKNGSLEQDRNRMVLNAYDASAVEEALTITESHGGTLEVVMIGPEKSRETLRKALAMGAEKGHHIVCEDISRFDSEIFATILSKFAGSADFNVILTGKQAQDTDAGLTGSMLADKLGLPYTTNAVAISSGGTTLTITRQGDAGQEIIELPTPCLVTCSNDMNNPRIPNLKGIMQSKKKPVDTLTLEDLGLKADELISTVQKIEIQTYRDVPGRKPGQKFEDAPDELANKLVSLLEKEAKVL